MGRSRTSKLLKMQQGTYRKDRDVDPVDAEPLYKEPPAPRHLGRYGKKAWERIAFYLHEAGILTQLDLETLEVCCCAYQTHRELWDAIYQPRDPATGKKRSRSLEMYLDKWDGKLLKELQKAHDQYMRSAKMLGLSPTARKGIDLAEGRKHREISDTERILNEVEQEKGGMDDIERILMEVRSGQ